MPRDVWLLTNFDVDFGSNRHRFLNGFNKKKDGKMKLIKKKNCLDWQTRFSFKSHPEIFEWKINNELFFV
jgi:hypothetical protein